MQSQQKKVKWSRGETANALEERTDTGITNVSVAQMENCTADIYGNISRRPALAMIPIANGVPGFPFSTNCKHFVFYITEDDFILLQVGGEYGGRVEVNGMRIQNETIVASTTTRVTTGDYMNMGNANRLRYAQYNNYALIANEMGIAKITITLGQNDSFTINLDRFAYSGGWFAPNGTQTKTVSANTLAGLNVNSDGLGFTNYSVNEGNGITTVYSAIDLGVSASQYDNVVNQIPLGSIIQFPNIGAYMRVETFDFTGPRDTAVFPGTFTGLLSQATTIPQSGTYLNVMTDAPIDIKTVTKYVNGTATESKTYQEYTRIIAKTSAGWQSQNGSDQWASYDTSNLHVMVAGPLLTPAAKEDATDTTINVEYGFVALAPNDTSSAYPHPSTIAFLEQRLWAGGWKINNANDAYALVVGSQIGRYNDFKNDYNTGAEAITLDIATQFKEEVLYLVDYNGLKIFTDTSEWAYQNGGAFKQSNNGSTPKCQPIVFGSICLYADQTGSQIRAMQYELQSDIFNSSIINQMTPGDLVWQPVAMAQYEDKVNNTGRHLFVLNSQSSQNPTIATSNFVPSNQAAIWSRWTVPTVEITSIGQTIATTPLVTNIVDTKRYPIFMVAMAQNHQSGGIVGNITIPILMPAVLNFDNRSDMGGWVDNGQYVVAERTESDGILTTTYKYTIPNATVVLYNGTDAQYAAETTTDENGFLAQAAEDDMGIGLPIHAIIKSHPVDVGGKTKTINKRIAKAVMSVRNTEPGAVTINSKTGYMNPAKDMINFYGVTGMKREIIYTITNNKGAKFTIESLTMNIEYGTLIS